MEPKEIHKKRKRLEKELKELQNICEHRFLRCVLGPKRIIKWNCDICGKKDIHI